MTRTTLIQRVKHLSWRVVRVDESTQIIRCQEGCDCPILAAYHLTYPSESLEFRLRNGDWMDAADYLQLHPDTAYQLKFEADVAAPRLRKELGI